MVALTMAALWTCSLTRTLPREDLPCCPLLCLLGLSSLEHHNASSNHPFENQSRRVVANVVVNEPLPVQKSAAGRALSRKKKGDLPISSLFCSAVRCSLSTTAIDDTPPTASFHLFRHSSVSITEPTLPKQRKSVS